MEVTKDRVAGITGAGLVAVLGGIATVVGSLLAWVTIARPGFVRARRSLDVRGFRLFPGKVALVAGIVLILCGIGLWVARTGQARRWWALLAAVAGGVVLGATIAAFQPEGAGLARFLGGTLRTRPRVGGQGSRILSLFRPGHGPGLYLALTGGIVGLAGAVAAVLWSTAPVGEPRTQAVAEPEVGSTFSKGRVA